MFLQILSWARILLDICIAVVAAPSSQSRSLLLCVLVLSSMESGDQLNLVMGSGDGSEAEEAIRSRSRTYVADKATGLWRWRDQKIWRNSSGLLVLPPDPHRDDYRIVFLLGVSDVPAQMPTVKDQLKPPGQTHESEEHTDGLDSQVSK